MNFNGENIDVSVKNFTSPNFNSNDPVDGCGLVCSSMNSADSSGDISGHLADCVRLYDALLNLLRLAESRIRYGVHVNMC